MSKSNKNNVYAQIQVQQIIQSRADNKQQMFQWHWARKARVCMFSCEVDMVKVLGYGWHVLPGGCVNCDCMLPWKLSSGNNDFRYTIV